MDKLPTLHRRRFIKLGTLATSAILLPHVARAATEPLFSLPPLPYDVAALEPVIDATTMGLHHGKHHASYIEKLNKALDGASQLKGKSIDEILGMLPDLTDSALQTTIRNNGGGHWNHAFFWNTMTPQAKSGKPSEKLDAAIKASFGSLDGLKKAFGEAAAGRFGSAWVWLIEQDGKLKITRTANQDNPLMKGIVPDSDLGKSLLGLDLWEHAYYLKYQNRAPEYVTAWWDIVNWDAVSKRFEG